MVAAIVFCDLWNKIEAYGFIVILGTTRHTVIHCLASDSLKMCFNVHNPLPYNGHFMFLCEGVQCSYESYAL